MSTNTIRKYNCKFATDKFISFISSSTLENDSTNFYSKHLLPYDILEYKKCRTKSVGEEGKGTSLNTVYAI